MSDLIKIEMDSSADWRDGWYLVATPYGSDADLGQPLAGVRVTGPPGPERRLDQYGQLIQPDATEFFQLPHLHIQCTTQLYIFFI